MSLLRRQALMNIRGVGGSAPLYVFDEDLWATIAAVSAARQVVSA